MSSASMHKMPAPTKWKLGDWISRGFKVSLGGCLLGFFTYEVVAAYVKWKQDKIAVSMSTYYEEGRMMPSFSICFESNRERNEYTGTNVELELNMTRCAR